MTILNPKLQSLIRDAIAFELTEFHVALPGKVESYDSAKGTANIKPMLSRRLRGKDQPTEYPVIAQVPVMQPRTEKARINFPVEPGDLCLIIFSDRSIENWAAGDGSSVKEAQDVRRHDLSDAFAIIGCYPSQKSAPPKFPGALNIEVDAGTKIALTNGSVELLDLFSQVFDALDTILVNIEAITVLTAGVPSGTPVNSPAFVADQLVLTKIKTLLEQLKA